MPWTCTKEGQKTWGGKNRLEITQEAKEYETGAAEEPITEVANRLREIAALLTHNAERMSAVHD